MSRVFSMQLNKSKCVASFVESDSAFNLTIFKRSMNEEYYRTPPISITFTGEECVKRLYKLLVKADKDDFFKKDLKEFKFTKYENIQVIATNHPTTVCNFSRGDLIILESDDNNGNSYKPAKEMKLEHEEISKLYQLLKYIFGSPLSVKIKTVNMKINKESSQQHSGWDLIK
ncbi:hypothetical protein AWH56_016105 [Anaerobacillus isosaccharinicus]|uniref:Uncharacterized protein n=1 Tax=Anaerobacillus isosaccharinicus TaxID=1532552 RepID=A0A1S2LNA1_9BACI|nr:hypothetical protein [Anaerobacillus isosaccharinicus]MBA5587576.1 hypothetical protein [Anaerobacillus isosaccharinicus]QOY34247.1 hypothetical protein AWH56_016105 [Anaerobacillus isosaccharinicus]